MRCEARWAQAAAAEVRESAIEVNGATGRSFLIEFAPDPDIIIREEMEHQHYCNVVAIEVKSGTDASNIHNRIGEAEKSHQKARQRGFTECWTVVNVGRLDMGCPQRIAIDRPLLFGGCPIAQGWRRVRRLLPPCAVADGHSCRADEPVSHPPTLPPNPAACGFFVPASSIDNAYSFTTIETCFNITLI
jgi:hypothetical protein